MAIGRSVRKYIEGDDNPYGVAAQAVESAQHIHQQLQANFCPACNGSGVAPVQDTPFTKVCRICGGTGERPAV